MQLYHRVYPTPCSEQLTVVKALGFLPSAHTVALTEAVTGSLSKPSAVKGMPLIPLAPVAH